MPYQRPPARRFINRGIKLHQPIDAIGDFGYAILNNVRSYTEGQIQPRPGVSRINTTAMLDLSVHSVRRLNDDNPGAAQSFALVVGAGTGLYTDTSLHNSFTRQDTGYSGSPLALTPFRPEQSPEPWMYVGDSNKLRKIRADGTNYQQGITPPNKPPIAQHGALAINQMLLYNSPGPVPPFGMFLAPSGTAGALSAVSRINTTISHILYDTGSTGWCLINAATMDNNIQPLCQVTINGQETLVVDDVFGAVTATAIANPGGIVYDSGSTGTCTIVLNTTPETVIKNALIQIGVEFVRILDVITAPSGVPAIRVSTVGTHFAGEAVTGFAAFRVNAGNTYSAGQSLVMNCVRSTVAAGVGGIDQSSILFPIQQDFSFIGARPIGPDDYLHISVRLDNPANLIEGQFLIDLDTFNHDYQHNAFYFPFRASDFQPVVGQTLTQILAKQRRIQRHLIDTQETITRLQARKETKSRAARIQHLEAEAERLAQLLSATSASATVAESQGSSSQSTAGTAQWTEFKIPIGQLQRIGSDVSRGLQTFQTFRIQVNVSSSTILDVNAAYFAGSYGPDIGNDNSGTPYIYRYRYRSSVTGAKSYWSPPMFSGILPHRQTVLLTPGVYSSDPQADKIDWGRFGGTLNQWNIIGTQPNSGTFSDNYADQDIASTPLIDFTDPDFQPYVTSDLPRSATVNVAGVVVSLVLGSAFNTNWVEGTTVFINSVPYSLYGSPTSGTTLFIDRSAGQLSNATMFIPEPELAGTALPAQWGPWGLGQTGAFMFACGDLNDPGLLYYLHGNDPDAHSDKGYLEVTSGSEVLMNGLVHNNQNFVFSDMELYQIILNEFDAVQGIVAFTASKTPCGHGLFSRWGYCSGGGYIWFLGRDGIYRTQGGESAELVSGDLWPLFPHDGQFGVITNGYPPPDFFQVSFLRLSWYDGYLMFCFKDVNANFNSFILNQNTMAWESYDSYTPQMCYHYGLEGRGVHGVVLGGTDGRVYNLTGQTDQGFNFSSEVRTAAYDEGDGRAKKTFGDVIVDIDPNNATITSQLGFDNYTSLPASTAITGSGRAQTVVDIGSGSGQQARNIALDLSWTNHALQVPQLYLWQESFEPMPENSVLRRTTFDDSNYKGPKWVQGIRIHADTNNTARTVQVQADTGANGVMVNQFPLTIQHNGQCIVDYPIASTGWTPFICHGMRLLPTDSADNWQLFEVEWIWEPEPPLVTQYTVQPNPYDVPAYFHYPECQIAHRSTADITLTITPDVGNPVTLTIPNGNGAYQRTWFRPPALKTKWNQISFTSAAGFRLYQRDSWIKTAAWNRTGPAQMIALFGDQSRVSGARI